MVNVYEDSFAGTASTSLVGRHPTSLASDTPNTGQTYPALAGGSNPFLIDGSGRAYQSVSDAGADNQAIPITPPTSGTFAITFDTHAGAIDPADIVGVVLNNSDGTNHYQFYFANSHSGMDFYRGGGNIGAYSLTIATGHAYALSITYASPASGSGTVTISITLTIDGGSPTTILDYTDTSGGAINGIQYVTVNSSGAASNTRFKAASLAAAGDVMAITPNLGDVVITGTDSATVTATAPTGGSGSFTYTWHLSQTTNFTPSGGDLVSGQTGLTATFTGLSANENHWVVSVFSDGVTTANSDHRLIRLSGLAPLRFGVIGDSTDTNNLPGETINGANFAASDHAAILLSTRHGGREVVLSNQAISGTSTGNWLSGGADLNAALAAFTSAGMTAGDWVHIRLGVNDAQTGVEPDTFGSNLTNLVGAVTAAGYKVILSYPIWREPGVALENTELTFDEANVPLLLSYMPLIDALIDGTTVFAGDKRSFFVFASQPVRFLNRSTEFPGGVHPNVYGAECMGVNFAQALEVAMGLDGTVPAATQYFVFGIPSAPVVGESYPVVIVLDNPASASGVVTFGAHAGITWGGTISIGSGGVSGTTTATFTASGSYTPSATHTGLGFSGNPTLSAVTAADPGGDFPTADEIADAILTRDWTAMNGEIPERCALNALRFLRNAWATDGTTLAVKTEDDTTNAWTKPLTTSADALPVTGTGVG